MSKGIIFFCCACTILLFTIINLSVGPVISGRLENWGSANCAIYKDNYDDAKENDISGDALKYGAEWILNYCNNHKAMYNMEYTSFVFDIVLGFICALLGLLHLFDVKKDLVSKTGLIGLGCGIIGFVLTFVYIILNGIVYTTTYQGFDIYFGYSYSGITKRDGDGVFAEKDGSDYKCIYYDSEYNIYALYAKYSDLGKKQYNYNKDLIKTVNEAGNCVGYASYCESNGKITAGSTKNNRHGNPIIIPPTSDCDKLYAETEDGIENKDISDRFLTTLLLGLFVCLANIGLAIFGFLLFRTGEF